LCKKLNKFRYYTNINILKIDKNIPKIIHQIAPIDIKKWHPLWKECQETWKLKFPRPEYKYKLWNDEEDLENLIKNDFPFFLKIYKKYSRKNKQKYKRKKITFFMSIRNCYFIAYD